MTEQVQPKGPLRYRLYYRLMDLCLITIIIWILEIISLSIWGEASFGLTGAFDAVFTLLLVAFGMVCPFVLLMAKFMRDEYAQQLWERAVIVLAYGVGLLPLIFLVIFNIADTVFGQAGAEELYPAWALVEWRIVNTFYVLCLIYMLLFVSVFQFLRWGESR